MKTKKRILMYVHRCLKCFWDNGTEITWSSPEPLGKCEICGDHTVAKKCSFKEVYVEVEEEDENDEDN